GYTWDDGIPLWSERVGVFAEWFRVSALITADRELQVPEERLAVAAYMASHSDLFHVQRVPIPYQQRGDSLHFKLECYDDLDCLDDILEALGPDRIDWAALSHLVESHPGLKRRLSTSAIQSVSLPA
ncbi:MAG TPA: hypothetical protein VIY86_02830, partial [Pirellulaceae bacterium]